MAAAATAVAIAFALSPAVARSCDEGNEPCTASQANPMKLDQFMKTWKPVAAKRANVSKGAKKQKAAPRPATKQVAEPAVAETTLPSEAPPSETPPSEAESTLAATPEKTIETDGVAITSFNDLNELDATADQVQVVAFNEVNEIDLAAPSPPPLAPSSETTGQSIVSPEGTPADNSWIGKLLLAMAGTIAVVGTARLLIA
jgi:hypothetical protein